MVYLVLLVLLSGHVFLCVAFPTGFLVDFLVDLLTNFTFDLLFYFFGEVFRVTRLFVFLDLFDGSESVSSAFLDVFSWLHFILLPVS